MVSRPSPFKSRCLAILNFKNGACILSAWKHPLRIVLPAPPALWLTPFPGWPCEAALKLSLCGGGPPAGASECIVYAAIRETYCRPANNERFPRGRSAVFILPRQLETLRSVLRPRVASASSSPSPLRALTGFPASRSANCAVPHWLPTWWKNLFAPWVVVQGGLKVV